ncbi:uncharacterized protein [Coffea arabica]|uniref:Endonuclease/exonuclease/phosphatase domain-containing protein n=1 Tax=Coffea arabica TaxID=13443 RepID=A0ABM4W418_COFAR
MDIVQLKLGMDWGVANHWGTIWIFYKSVLSCSVIGESSQHISLQVQCPMFPSTVCFSFVHAKCTVQERESLWAELLLDRPTETPWCLAGDFNVIVHEEEKRGGLPFRLSDGLEFGRFMLEVGVSDADFSGSKYTWCNNRKGRARVWKRLDRILLNLEALQMGSSISVQHLARDPSDHSPLLMSAVTRLDNKPKPFRFLNVWTTKGGVLEVIRDAWSYAERAVREAEIAQEHDSSDHVLRDLNVARERLRATLATEEVFWRQKARVRWLKDGDRNSQYFHAVVTERRSRAIIHRIRGANGEWVESEDLNSREAISFFQGLFTAE